MPTRYPRILGTLAFVALTALSLTAGCGDNPVDDHEKDHFEAEGLVLRINGIDTVTYIDGIVTGTLEVPAGEETDLFSVEFVEVDGARGTPDDSDFNLGFTVADTTIAQAEQHDDDGRWRFHLKGNKAGTTTLTLKLLHVDHADFTAKPITVTVHP